MRAKRILLLTLGLLALGGVAWATGADSATAHFEASKLAINKKFMANDPDGLGITVIAMTVVLSALALISILFMVLKPMIRVVGATTQSVTGIFKRVKSVAVDESTTTPGGHENAVIAAIAMALHEHTASKRDEEIISITIKEVSRRYSPWSSKRYGMRNQLPRPGKW